METFKAIMYWALYAPRFLWRLFLNVWGKLAKKLVGWDSKFKESVLATLIVMSPIFAIPLLSDKDSEWVILCIVCFLFSFPLLWAASYSEN